MPQALTLKHVEGGKPGKVYYPLQIKEVPKPAPGPREVLVRLSAAALNRRDLFIRQHLYPAISFSSPLLADGYGTVVAVGPGATRAVTRSLLGKAVVLAPMRGWDASPRGPEDPRSFSVVGASKVCEGVGTAQEYLVVSEEDVEPAPEHLSPAEGAALPLAGLTGWRALVTKASAAVAVACVGVGGNADDATAAALAALSGSNILVTGIGGGVALQILQFGVALGCDVFVTSSSASKIQRAVVMGARGGVNYKSARWDSELAALLPKSRPYLDAVIDGSGGDVVARTARLLKPGGVISQYGMTVSPRMDWPMQAVLANVELRGTSMGSRREFRDMVAFVREKRIRPVVSRTVRGLDNIEEIDGLFEDMKKGRQFGKLVIEFEGSPESRL